MRCSVGSFAFIILISLINHVHYAFGGRLTFEMDSGREACFNLSADRTQTLDVEYAVVGVTHGSKDINFQLIGPKGPIVTEFRKTHSSYMMEVKLTGSYSCCFDNTYSSFNMKRISFTFELDKSKASWPEFDDYEPPFQPEGKYEVQIKIIKKRIDRIRAHLEEVEFQQQLFRERESIDRTAAEKNFDLVNLSSIINCLFIMTIGTIQVLMVKGLIDDKYNFVKTIITWGPQAMRTRYGF